MIDRRSALRRMIACSTIGALWAFDQTKIFGNRDEWEIVPGSHVGPLSLGISEREVTKLLGQPPERCEFPGYDVESLRRVSLKAGVPFDKLPTADFLPSVHLIYPSIGLGVRLEENRTKCFFIYTGIPAGYQKAGDMQPFFGSTSGNSLVALSNLDDVVRAMGIPQYQDEMKHAEIPETYIGYLGITFSFESATRKLSCLKIQQG